MQSFPRCGPIPSRILLTILTTFFFGSVAVAGDDSKQVAWHVDTFHAENLNGNGVGNLAAWCGSLEYQCPDEEDGGYGNNLQERLAWSGTVTDPLLPTQVTIEGWLNHNVESGFDWVSLGYYVNGSSEPEIVQLWDGVGENIHFQHTINYTPGEYLGVDGKTVRLEFFVSSDQQWSDEDCLYLSNGAAQVDDLTVTVDNGNIAYHEDFESGGLGQWVAISGNVSRLSDEVLAPVEGQVGDTFTWDVVWTDMLDTEPVSATVRVVNPSGSLTIHDLATSDPTFVDGAVYSFTTELSEIGTYSYYFSFVSETSQVISLMAGESGLFNGPLVTEQVIDPPILSTVTLAPVSGDPGTEFTFTINYLQADNVFPALVSDLNIKNPISGETVNYPMVTEDADCRDGAEFSTVVSLTTPGAYQYQFVFLLPDMQFVTLPGGGGSFFDGPTVVVPANIFESPRHSMELLDAYPNPFNPRGTIAFVLPRESSVSLRIFDLNGRRVRILLNGETVAEGRNEVHWNGDDTAGEQVASGVYFYQLESGGFVETKQMLLIK